jgi:hypothetical protein
MKQSCFPLSVPNGGFAHNRHAGQAGWRSQVQKYVYDDLRRTAGGSWMLLAEDRARWREIGEAYV